MPLKRDGTNPGGFKKGADPRRNKIPPPATSARLSPDRREFRDIAREHCADAVRVILDLMQNSTNEKIRIDAAQYVVDHAWGRAIQRSEVQIKRELNELTRDELVAIASGGRATAANGRPAEPDPVHDLH